MTCTKNNHQTVFKAERHSIVLPLVSVIIPVYDVELYLRKCIDSVLAQTYQNYEVVLVDDGSPDRCGEICDMYAAQDARVKTIHQSCQGLSAARNAGLDAACGEYVFFIDSDDFVEPCFCSSAMEAALRLNADIVCFGYRIVNLKGQIRKTITFTREEIIFPKQAISLLLSGSMPTDVWEKAFRRTLFDEIRFPVGLLSEITLLSPQLFDEAQRIALIPMVTYNHLFPRKGSICTDPTEKFRKDSRMLESEKFCYIKQTHPDLAPAVMEAEFAFQFIQDVIAYCSANGTDKKHNNSALFLYKKKSVMKCPVLYTRHKAWFLLFLISPNCAKGLFRFRAQIRIRRLQREASV